LQFLKDDRYHLNCECKVMRFF